MPDFGSGRPSGPLVYTFTITVGQTTYTETLDLGISFVEELPSLVSPANNATTNSKPAFGWSPITASCAMYQDSFRTRIWGASGRAAIILPARA